MAEQQGYRLPNLFMKLKAFGSLCFPVFNRDASGPFEFGSLPRELQEMILLKVAVTRRLSCWISRPLYRDLALVSHAWSEMISDPWFDKQVIQQAYQRGQ